MKVWINQNFSLLWTGQLVSQLGDKFYAIAMAWWVLERTHSPAVMGLFMVASMLPELILGPVAGGFIDRWNRKAILIVADMIRGLAVVAAALLSWSGCLEMWHIFTAAIIISLSSAFFNPTVMSVIPQLVSAEDLSKANSLSQMISGISAVAGPVAGAVLISLLGYEMVFLINGLSYLVSAFMEFFIALPVLAARETKLSEDIKDGLKFIYNNKPVLIVLLVIGIVHFFYGSLVVSMPFLANTLAGNGVQNLGYLETAMGLGIIIGSVILHRKERGNIQGHLLFVIIMGAGICYTLMGLISSFGVIMTFPYIAILLFIGMATAIASVYWRTLLHMYVPNEMAGRVFSISTMVADVTLPVSFGLFGVMLNNFSMSITLAVCGANLVIMSSILLIRYKTETGK